MVAWCQVAESPEDVVVATNHGLWLPSAVDRLGWHEIHKAAWSGRELRITPAETAVERDGYTVLVDGPVVSFLLLEPGELPDQVRARVTRSVAYTSHHSLPAGAVRVVGRRVPGRNGLSWAVRYDSGTPVDADEVLAATDELVGAARSATEAVD
ncbi:hypothetical protein SAMN05421541_102702 [Actinoplanes philippinensis]|uniref:Uncharacterized protein n=1 Tax=Actinoplanes philippinensis TaxID=35752 RepID=A0A1I2C3K7_9ACTN|nr:hypothetical protein SAMN05421541_102702 [Actinoplanes philippinensis]